MDIKIGEEALRFKEALFKEAEKTMLIVEEKRRQKEQMQVAQADLIVKNTMAALMVHVSDPKRVLFYYKVEIDEDDKIVNDLVKTKLKEMYIQTDIIDGSLQVSPLTWRPRIGYKVL